MRDGKRKCTVEARYNGLNKPGYAQELFREMGWFSNFASAFSTISILTGLIQLYGYGVALVGGAVFWTWVLVGVFQLFNALSMGEIASSFQLPAGWRRFPLGAHLIAG